MLNQALIDISIQLQQIDYTPLIKMLSFAIVQYTNVKLLNGYNLHKDFKPKNIRKVNLPPELIQKYYSIDVENIIIKEFGNEVVKFAEVMIDSFSQKDLINLYNNLREVRIKIKNFYFYNKFIEPASGLYNALLNKIILNAENYDYSLYHELLHMASRIIKNGVTYVGFNQVSLTKNIGFAINEGYTTLLSGRYFGQEIKNDYFFEATIVAELEKIVGQKKMESLYLNADLYGLITELKKYVSEEEIMDFISKTDFFMKYKSKLLFEDKRMKCCVKTIAFFLLKTYGVKLKGQLNNGEITKDEFKNMWETYSDSVNCIKLDFIFKRTIYDFVYKENYAKNIFDILGKPLEESEITDEFAYKGR